ncbi:MAG TPA: 30S ribosome-binding factor RbfA [Patescibacteria group bacterium]|nr:30S ribosome-binding factor RbfA [Patescibacteria group bacterium]
MKRRPTNSRSEPGQRQLRVAERIRHLLADVLRRGELHDPALAQASLISVTAVEIGPDLKHATAYVMPLGGKNVDAVVSALNRASSYFRACMAPELDLRYAPKVSFRFDKSFENAAHIENILRQDRVQRDIHAPVREDDEGGEEEDEQDDER